MSWQRNYFFQKGFFAKMSKLNTSTKRNIPSKQIATETTIHLFVSLQLTLMTFSPLIKAW